MCLFTNRKRPIITDENITTYKVLFLDLKSIMQQFQYEMNKPYTEEFVVDIDDDIIVFDGFHSYLTKEIAEVYFKRFALDIDSYFESLKKRYKGICIAECTIPKGSKIYYGIGKSKGECCSNKIIINHKIEQVCA